MLPHISSHGDFSIIKQFDLGRMPLVKAPVPTGSTLSSDQLAGGSVRLRLQKRLASLSAPVLKGTARWGAGVQRAARQAKQPGLLKEAPHEDCNRAYFSDEVKKIAAQSISCNSYSSRLQGSQRLLLAEQPVTVTSRKRLVRKQNPLQHSQAATTLGTSRVSGEHSWSHLLQAS